MYLPKGVLHLPGIAMHVWGRQGSWPSGVLWPCLEARGLQNLLQPLGQTLLLLSYQRYSMSWLPDGAHVPSLEKPVVHVEMAVSHAFCHTMSKDIPSPSKCKPKSFDCYCFPALFFSCSGFSFSVHTKSILKSTQNFVFSFFFF